MSLKWENELIKQGHEWTETRKQIAIEGTSW